jgi:hypothetical protein
MINLVNSCFVGCCGSGSDASRFVDLNVPANKDKEMGHVAYLVPFCWLPSTHCYRLFPTKLSRIPFYRRITVTHASVRYFLLSYAFPNLKG